MVAAAGVVILELAFTPPIFAQEYGVDVAAQAVSSFAQPGCSTGNPTYTTAGGLAAGQASTGAPGCSESSSGPAAAGLTTATVTSTSSASTGPTTTRTDTATATADLATASLHAVGAAPGGGQGVASVQWFDTLTFIVSGTASVEIPVTFGVDGTAIVASPPVPIGGPDFATQQTTITAGAEIRPGAASCNAAQQLFQECVGNDLGWEVQGNNGTSTVTVDPAQAGQGIDSAQSISDLSASDMSWGSGDINGGSFGAGSITWNPPVADSGSNADMDFVADGILTLAPGTDVITVGANLSVDSLIGTLDFSDTASLSFDVPSGVTYTSASGVFDTSSSTVPEPGSLALLGSALAVLGIACFRSQTAPPRRG